MQTQALHMGLLGPEASENPVTEVFKGVFIVISDVFSLRVYIFV